MFVLPCFLDPVEKLSPLRRDFKNYLNHKHKELKLKDLIVRLRIEEDNEKSEKRSNKNSYEAKVNVIKDSKRKASTFKGLNLKKTTPESKESRRKEQAFQKNLLHLQQRDTRQIMSQSFQKEQEVPATSKLD